MTSAFECCIPWKILFCFWPCQEAGVNFSKEAVKFEANVKHRWHLEVLKKLITKVSKPLEQMCAFTLQQLKVKLGWNEVEIT